ncbi:MAG: TIGR04283 family arsenosugar biosynthesis glycosyltransferase [Acidiferrobacterales bacterium]
MVIVIIPTYNEEKALPATLEHLLRQAGEYEVIVVDGGSSDRTCQIVRGEPRVRLLTASKGRASQMNTGACIARGEWLLFLHADTFLPEGALRRLNALEADTACQAGGFRHRFSGNDWRLRLISWMDNLRTKITCIIYGDQAMFVRRSLFQQLGGFPQQPFLEDIAFGEKLKRVTKPVLLDQHVITDSRKFVQMGIWRSLTRCAVILLCHGLRLPIAARAFFADIR